MWQGACRYRGAQLPPTFQRGRGQRVPTCACVCGVVLGQAPHRVRSPASEGVDGLQS